MTGVGKPRLFYYNVFAFRLWRNNYRIENGQIWSVLSCGAIDIYAVLREIAGLNIFLDFAVALTTNFTISRPMPMLWINEGILNFIIYFDVTLVH